MVVVAWTVGILSAGFLFWMVGYVETVDLPKRPKTLHVVPRGDLIAHDTSDYYACTCGPSVECVPGGWVVTHHSLDGRERLEVQR